MFTRSVFVCGLVCLYSSTAMAQLSSTGVENPPDYYTFQPPPVGNSYLDPVFGSSILRVSNAPGMHNADLGGYLSFIENEYSTVCAFNSDNSRFVLVHESYFGLYDGVAGAYLYDLPLEMDAQSEPRWSRSDNHTLYYLYKNQLKSLDTGTEATRVVHTFSDYAAISGVGETDISLDGDHFVFAGDNRFIFVYQISTDQVFPALDAAGNAFVDLQITPQNNVIVSWKATGETRFTGQELFDINLNFLRQVGHADGHKHATVDTNGDEVVIWTNSNDADPIPNCQNGIVKIRLADATQTCLLQLDWSLAVHITAPDGDGWAFVDTEAPANPDPGSPGWVPYTDELLQIKLDGSSVLRLAHHRSRPQNSYSWQPKNTVSRDGRWLLYASNFGLSGKDGNSIEYADTYLIQVGPPVEASGASIRRIPGRR